MSHLRCLWPLYCIVNRKNNNRNNCMSKGVAGIAGMVVFRFQVELMELFVKLLVGLLVKLLLGCEGESKNVGDMLCRFVSIESFLWFVDLPYCHTHSFWLY